MGLDDDEIPSAKDEPTSEDPPTMSLAIMLAPWSMDASQSWFQVSI